MLAVISLIYIVGGWAAEWQTHQPWLFLAWIMTIFGGVRVIHSQHFGATKKYKW